MSFYVLLRGRAVLEVAGADAIELAGDDIAFVAPERAHVLRDAITSEAILAHDPPACDIDGPAAIGGRGARSTLVVGWFELGSGSSMFARADPVSVLRATPALASAIELVRAELGRMRMALAAELLRETDATIVEIAERTGYTSVPSFSKAFKRWRGNVSRDVSRGSSASAKSVDEGERVVEPVGGVVVRDRRGELGRLGRATAATDVKREEEAADERDDCDGRARPSRVATGWECADAVAVASDQVALDGRGGLAGRESALDLAAERSRDLGLVIAE